jgi:hypothetical protein
MPVRHQKSDCPPPSATFDAIEAKSIALRAGDGKASIVLQALEQGVGIWVSSGNGDNCVCIIAGQDDSTGAYVGVHGEDSLKEVGCPLAMTAKGIQVCNRKATVFMTLEQLLSMANDARDDKCLSS